jgi:uncharacterized protein YbjT (DUF2867 family)
MIVITGATGKTGSKVAAKLLERGETVRVVGRSAERLEPFREKGAETAVGDQCDVSFMTQTLTGADALYLLIPPKIDAEDFRTYYHTVTDAAVDAILMSGIGKVVFLSSLGGDKAGGTGPVVGLHDAEEALKTLKNVDIVFLRPAYFMENTLGMMEMITTRSITGGSMPGHIKMPVAATEDIADKAVELLVDRSFTGHTSVEIISDRISFDEIARILGRTLDIPSLRYMEFSDSDTIVAFMGMGFSRSVASSYVELMHGIADGLVKTQDHEPEHLSGKIRFTDFARQVFKPAFTAAKHHTMA